jgi:hypothetical protein
MNNSKIDFYKGMTCVVTGASSGIGEVFARSLAERGARLVLVARSQEKLLKLSAELRSKYGTPVEVLGLDLSSPDAAKKVFEFTQSRGLSVDILVNNAGFGRQDAFELCDPAECDEMLRVNICAAVALARLFIPGMLQRKKGGVINVSSTAAFQPLPYFALYAASKSFILHFSEALWGEYSGRGINILALCPGHTRTHFHARAGVEDRHIRFADTPERVVRGALDAFSKGKPTLVSGKKNHMLSNLNRLFTRRSVIQIAGRIFKPAAVKAT